MVYRILIIENDPDVARSLQLELKLNNYEVILADESSKGIQRFQESAQI
jgi:DNA-binding response OmpR family regulator